MQREVPGVVLQDELRRLGVDDVIVAALADRDAVEQLVAAVERLAKLQDVAFALQGDAELLAHRRWRRRRSRPDIARVMRSVLPLSFLISAVTLCASCANDTNSQP